MCQRLPHQVIQVMTFLQGGPLPSYKWGFAPYKWPYTWGTGVVTPLSLEL